MSEATICKDGHWIHTECQAYEAGKKEAEARIIKLLEGERWVLPDGSPAGGEILMPLEQAIALIKGETE